MKPAVKWPTLFTVQVPAIGAVWRDQGGRFAGIVFDDDGKPAYALILYDKMEEALTWSAASKWAKGLKADGHKDFQLPGRRGGSVLFANNHILKIQHNLHWLAEEHTSSYAWYQYFLYGNQYYYRKVNRLRARAVRRVAL